MSAYLYRRNVFSQYDDLLKMSQYGVLSVRDYLKKIQVVSRKTNAASFFALCSLIGSCWN